MIEWKSRRSLRRVADVLRGRATIDELLRPERYGLDFPEQAFLPRARRRAAYDREVQSGREVASRQSCVICTALHQCVDLVPHTRARIHALAACFSSSQLVVLGEDSTDGTEQLVRDWAEAPNVVSVPPIELPRGRFRRMAALRNALLDAADAHESDLLIMMDGDLGGPISLDGIGHAVGLLDRAPSAGGVTAFGINNWGGVPGLVPFVGYSYYDPLAFREHQWPRVKRDPQIRLRLGSLRRGDPPLTILSGFAGLAIYSRDAIAGLRYPDRNDDCEHVHFHRLLADRGYQLLLDPSLMLLAGRQGHHLSAS